MKKQKVSKLDTLVQTEIAKLKMELSEADELPTVEAVNASVQQLTGQQASPTAAAQSGRPLKEAAKGRVKLTTMMQKSMIKWLKTYAIEQDMTTADVLENAVNLFKYEKDKNR
jgi:glutamyl-tRNA reductase